MKVIVQRAENAKVRVRNNITGKIDKGLMILVGFSKEDTEEKLEYMAKKIVNLRIFPDEFNIMNKSVLDVNGKILSVSQFTLYADCTKGNRPSYKNALESEKSEKLYLKFNDILRKYIDVETGIFREDMEVEFTNMGPTTIILER